MKMTNANEKVGYFAAILFLVWPLIAVATAFRNYKSSWSKNILWAFVAFYGFSFAIGSENQGSDIVRYVAELKSLHSLQMSLSDAVKYFLHSGEIDILKTVIAILVSRFTDMQSVLTLVYGIIFGYFFSRNMWYVLERLEGQIKPITILLFTCLFLVIPIWNINGFRFWTAAHIFVYGLLTYLFEEKRKGIIISASAVLVHFSYIIPLGVLFAYILLGNRLVAYFTFFLLTFFISEINLRTFNNIVENYAPEIIQERTASYRSETKVENFREGVGDRGVVWYALWYGRALKWSVMGFLVVLFVRGRDFFNEKKEWLNLFSFTLLFYAVANIFGSLPSGGRYVAIANLLALSLIVICIQNRNQDVVVNKFILAATPALILFMIVAFRTGLYSMSATTIIGNPILAFFINGQNSSLNDIVEILL